jgi:hypothetical protein
MKKYVASLLRRLANKLDSQTVNVSPKFERPLTFDELFPKMETEILREVDEKFYSSGRR